MPRGVTMSLADHQQTSPVGIDRTDAETPQTKVMHRGRDMGPSYLRRCLAGWPPRPERPIP